MSNLWKLEMVEECELKECKLKRRSLGDSLSRFELLSHPFSRGSMNAHPTITPDIASSGTTATHTHNTQQEKQ